MRPGSSRRSAPGSRCARPSELRPRRRPRPRAGALSGGPARRHAAVRPRRRGHQDRAAGGEPAGPSPRSRGIPTCGSARCSSRWPIPWPARCTCRASPSSSRGRRDASAPSPRPASTPTRSSAISWLRRRGDRRAPPRPGRCLARRERDGDERRPPDDDGGLSPGPELLELPGLVAACGHGTGLPHRRLLPAHRAHARGGQVPPGLLRRPPGHARPLRRRPRRVRAPRHPRGQARPDPAPHRDGAGHASPRRGRHLLDDVLRAVSRRPRLLDARPHGRRPRGLERGHVAERLRGGQLRPGEPSRARRPLRPRRRVHGGGARPLGHVGGRRDHPRPRARRLRRSRQGPSARPRGRVLPHARPVHRAGHAPGASRHHPGRSERAGPPLRGALGRADLRDLAQLSSWAGASTASSGTRSPRPGAIRIECGSRPRPT